MKEIDRIGSFHISILRHTDYHFKLEKLPIDIEDSLQNLSTWINCNPTNRTVVVSLLINKEQISFSRQKRLFGNVKSSLLTNLSCLSYIRGGRDFELPQIVSNKVSKHDFRTFIVMIQLWAGSLVNRCEDDFISDLILQMICFYQNDVSAMVLHWWLYGKLARMSKLWCMYVDHIQSRTMVAT